jgi:Protein phosphatase 2C
MTTLTICMVFMELFAHTLYTQPSRKDEAQRVEAAGGYVSRGCVNGVLRVTRSFGDIHCKVRLLLHTSTTIQVVHICLRNACNH